MPFQKGRSKTGGRKKDSIPLARIRRDVAEKLAELGYDPILRMVQIAESTEDKALRAKMAAELAKYVHPQRKAIEHSGINGEPIQITISPIEAKL